MIKVYDCFSYFNEDLVLTLRLQTLWDYVDYFIVAEAKFTQTGVPKPINFDISKFEKYESKIRHIIVEFPAGGTRDFWANENQQRNEIKKGLWDAKPEDWIIISDLDEIPNPDAIKIYNPRYLRGDFQQLYFSYYFNNQLIEPTPERHWFGSKITTYKHFKNFFRENATSVRSYKSRGPMRLVHRFLFRKFKVQIIKNGGWHFTWILPPEKILLKMSVMAHQENNRSEWRSPARIKNLISQGMDIIIPCRRYTLVEISEKFPKPLKSNADLYAEFIRKK